MSVRHLLGRMRWKAIQSVRRRNYILAQNTPVVSFTFDDFPESALSLGGNILKSHGVCGTFYAAMGLMNQVNNLGKHFSTEDLHNLLKDGHELGSHTFSHLSCRVSRLEEFEADFIKGRRAIEEVMGSNPLHQFSYPFGHVTFQAKPMMGVQATSCRGNIPGINKSPLDLNLLRANSIYSNDFDLDRISRLLEENDRCHGWIIFYTHDVTEKPSEYGCTPTEFESVVKLAVQSRAAIMPVGKIIVGAAMRRTD